uniref:Mannosyltransferase n=1 Tax=Panagrellus redivivus TaxID=6233 RepID=A0A7E4WCU2_PANRE
MHEMKQFFLCLTFRLMCFVFTDTWFVPDEYFQCTEVAYSMAFRRGHLTWEWIHNPPLRSYLHPLSIAWIYEMYRFLGIDTPMAVRCLPHLLHSFLFSLGDVAFIKMVNRIFFANPRGNANTLILYFTNWFIIYCSSRTLSNCVETALTLIALNWYPLYDDEASPMSPHARRRRKSFVPYMLFGTVAILIRPTAVLIFGPLGLWHLARSNERCRVMFFAILVCGGTVMSSILIDSDLKRPLKFPLLEFAKFNFFTGGSAHFGVHPWYWYFTDGLLITMTGAYFLALGGFIIQCNRPAPRSPPKILFVVALIYLAVHIWLPHKEHRFILPIIPLMLPFAGLLLQQVSIKRANITRGLLCIIVTVNLIVAGFVCRVHQRGVNAVTSSLIADITKDAVGPVHIVQLLPCYSMHQYAAFHKLNVRHHMLDCTPNLKRLPNYIDQSDMFHFNPVAYVKQHPKLLRPGKYAYVVIYKKTYKKLEKILAENGYEHFASFGHTPTPISANQDTVIVVLKRVVKKKVN